MHASNLEKNTRSVKKNKSNFINIIGDNVDMRRIKGISGKLKTL